MVLMQYQYVRRQMRFEHRYHNGIQSHGMLVHSLYAANLYRNLHIQ